MTRKDKIKYKKKLIRTLTLAYIFGGLAIAAIAAISLIFIFEIKELFETNTSKIVVTGVFGVSTGLLFMFFIMSVHYFTRLKLYRLVLDQKRSKHNFKIGMWYVNEDNFDKAIDVIDTIPDRKARTFFYHTVLYLGTNSKKPDVALAHRNHIEEKIKEHTT